MKKNKKIMEIMKSLKVMKIMKVTTTMREKLLKIRIGKSRIKN